jgi:hypothetical protein
MMYFKEADVPFTQIDPDQIKCVMAFRERVRQAGSLSQVFGNPDEFGGLLRLHLSRVVQEWDRRSARSVQASPPSETEMASAEAGSSDDDGLLDLLDVAGDAIASLTQNQERMTKALTELNERVELRVTEMRKANQFEAGQGSIKALRRATNGAAEDMEHFVVLMRPEITEFRRLFDDALTATGRSASLAVEAASSPELTEQLEELAGQIDAIATILEVNSGSFASFRNVVASLPRLTSPFNRARRNTTDILDHSIEEFTLAASAAHQASEVIRAMLN